MTIKKPRRYRTHGSRYRPEGTVHWALWSVENKFWYISCRSPAKGSEYNLHGRLLREDSDMPITCKNCKKGLGDGT